MEPIWQLLMQNGITQAEIELLRQAYLIIIMIPLVSTVLAILRYIVGIRSPNLSTLLILTFSFTALAIQGVEENFLKGLGYVSLLYFVVLIVSTLTYGIIKKWRMHYVPKMSIVFTAVSVSYILLIILGRFFDNGTLLLTNTFVVVIIATLAESMVSSYARKDLRYSLDLSIRTYFIGLFSFAIISLSFVKELLITYPYLLIILLILNFYIGRYKGLRLTEYFRFKNILLSNSNTDEQNKPDNTK